MSAVLDETTSSSRWRSTHHWAGVQFAARGLFPLPAPVLESSRSAGARPATRVSAYRFSPAETENPIMPRSAVVNAPCGVTPSVRTAPRWRRLITLVMACLLLLPSGGVLDAQRLQLDLIPPTQSGLAGSTLIFSGRITNTTGISLSATDLFLNFSGYDPTAIANVVQVLGSTNFTLPNNTFSAIVPLFDLTTALTAHTGNYSFDVTLQDLSNIVSDPVTATVTVLPSDNVVPEPSALVLLGGGALLMTPVIARRRRGASRDVAC